jgi:hypothetical protein
MPGIGPFNEQFQRFAGLERPTMQELEGQEIMGPPFRVGAGGQSRSYAGGGSGHGDAYTRALAVEMKDIRAAQRPPGPIQVRGCTWVRMCGLCLWCSCDAAALTRPPTHAPLGVPVTCLWC